MSYHDLLYQAGTWDRPRRVVFKIEWHAGELFPRVGLVVRNRTDPPRGVVRFHNGRDSCEQWIKENRHALGWARLSCHRFSDNAVRLVLPEEMARWNLTTLREKLVKIGARLARHARRLVLHMAGVAIPRDLFGQILSRIRSLSRVPT